VRRTSDCRNSPWLPNTVKPVVSTGLLLRPVWCWPPPGVLGVDVNWNAVPVTTGTPELLMLPVFPAANWKSIPEVAPMPADTRVGSRGMSGCIEPVAIEWRRPLGVSERE
jgi:hypothetical protein